MLNKFPNKSGFPNILWSLVNAMLFENLEQTFQTPLYGIICYFGQFRKNLHELNSINNRVVKCQWQGCQMAYLSLDDVERDDSTDLRQDGDDDGEEEEPDEAGWLGGAADPSDQPGEEEGEPKRDHHVRENL